ncbi:hypothetical protein KC332_g1573 [Hortaea werneckii]|nr:hypothetical protein KC350_g6955 [Hortaea werneckii]KAI6846705.1 hypothetical protein KC358_g2704 [Hortaea werneckii]KAI6943625.1 hypothetical protein KC341_g1364 [Hortaea werneckii]KAI6949294.1 hypothetical protein KC348_g1409 [Hortaea werneckii]KAI6979043.1 hypothetical protein KC321_g2562 [Hortaea werneckii]
MPSSAGANIRPPEVVNTTRASSYDEAVLISPGLLDVPSNIGLYFICMGMAAPSEYKYSRIEDGEILHCLAAQGTGTRR